MPDFWSHQFAAIEALNAKTNFIQEDVMSLYLLGAQGPDFFYYINKMNPFTKEHYGYIGNILHEKKIISQFESMLKYLLDHPHPENIAYFSGYLSHYILDVHCHPLICSLGPDSDSHKRVEMALDAMCFRVVWKKALKDLDLTPFKCNPHQMKLFFSPFWMHHLKYCFDLNIEPESLLKANKHMALIQNLLIKNHIKKIPFISGFSSLLHYDLSMLIYPEAINPEAYHFDTFTQVYRQGIEVIKAAFDALSKVLSHEIKTADFINTYIKNDFLGEAIDD